MQTWEVTGTLLVGRAAATGATSNAVAARAANRAMVPSSLLVAYLGLAPRASPITRVTARAFCSYVLQNYI